MIDSSTLKALASTILTFALVVAIGTLTSAIGQDTEPQATVPTANPYETVESDAGTASHNQPDRTPSATDVSHNMP